MPAVVFPVQSASISIHASREGSDDPTRLPSLSKPISIHASREGSDSNGEYVVNAAAVFQSTLPAREATEKQGRRHACNHNFNPRFPRGKRQREPYFKLPRLHFNPRFPRGKRPPCVPQLLNTVIISIHASREGSDFQNLLIFFVSIYFNPRFPRGKRQSPYVSRFVHPTFQSTLPAREATISMIFHGVHLLFQSTLPAREATLGVCHHVERVDRFQSTLPAREATLLPYFCRHAVKNFNPRFPRGKRQCAYCGNHISLDISIHASREGSDKRSSFSSDVSPGFQSTLPAREATRNNKCWLWW